MNSRRCVCFGGLIFDYFCLRNQLFSVLCLIMEKCSECDKTFCTLYNLRRHAYKFHPGKIDIIAPKKKFTYRCEPCKKNFNLLRDFNFHKKRHSTSTETALKKLPSKKKCALCQFDAPKDQLLIHFETEHDVQIKTEMLEFNSFEEFVDWKIGLENSTHAQFVKERGNFFTDNNKMIIKYICHRSGNYVSKGNGLRHLKTQGSNKIDGFCPASIHVEIENNKCRVGLISQHVGHQNDLGHLSLTLEEREKLANQMALKIPFAEILNQVRDSVQGSQLERIHLLTRRDLCNIAKSFNLQSTVIRHQNDAISIEAWVAEMESNGCVLFYKSQGVDSVEYKELRKEDFVLIIMNSGQEEVLKKYCSDCVCLDGTHGLNQYDFELHTLLILDDVREGFPCAFLISNRSDETVLKIFYHYIRERIGFQISCKVFMTDMAEAYYNAWKIVMGPAQFRLFCTWHTDRSWRKNLSKIKDSEKQIMVYKYLRTLLQERSVSLFSSMLEHFIPSILSDPVTEEFGEYFKNNYLNNVQSWAYCYRLNSGLNTNMSIERMHRTIKYIYFQGRKVKRLDKAIHEIQKFIRDRLFNRLIILNKGKLSNKLKMLRERHKTSEKLSTSLVVKNGVCWDISSTTPNCYEIYSVQENENIVPCQCNLKCTECNTCFHKYSCTCIDSCIRWNMCKHVHLLCRYLREHHDVNNVQPVPLNNIDVDTSLFMHLNPASDEVDGILTGLDGYKSRMSENKLEDKSNLTKEKEKIITNFIPDLTKVVENITCMEQIYAFKKMCAPIAPTLSAIESRQEDIKKTASTNKLFGPYNKKIIPQRSKLHSTKKKRKNQAVGLAVPTVQEKNEITLCAVTALGLGN